jgi:hypothetical protein
MTRLAGETPRLPAILPAAVLVVLLKQIFLLVDDTPRFFMGDSGSYILASSLDWVPFDRSYTYGYLIYLFGVLPRSLPRFIAVQTAFGAAASILLSAILARRFGVKPVVAVAAAIAASLDPTQLVLERQVMTETFALFLLAIVLAVALAYLDAPRLWKLLVVQAAGVALVSLRTVYVPVTLALAGVLPVLGVRAIGTVARTTPARAAYSARTAVAIHLAISLASALAVHHAYRAYTGIVSGQAPAYQYADGFFLISSVAPILVKADAASPAVARAISRSDLGDIDSRNWHRWGPTGLVQHIHDEIGDVRVANSLSRQTAIAAIRRDPLGVLSLAFQSYARYWVPSYMSRVIRRGDQQRNPHLRADFIRLVHERFGYRAIPRQNSEPVSLTQEFQVAFDAPWRATGLLSPLLATVALWACRPGKRPAALLVAIVTGLLFAMTMLTLTDILARYLQPLTWLGILSAAVALDGAAARWRRQPPRWKVTPP